MYTVFVNGGEVTSLLGTASTLKIVTDWIEFQRGGGYTEDEGYVVTRRQDEDNSKVTYVYVHEDGCEWHEFALVFTIVEVEIDVQQENITL